MTEKRLSCRDEGGFFERRDFLGLMAGGLAALALPRLGFGAEPGNGKPPNFIIIFTDDQGYADLGSYGAKGFETPRVDRMAKEGVRFTDFYVAAPVCTPSRAALLTGRYPIRTGLHRNVLFPDSKKGLKSGEVTIAELLKTRDYATACIGKWHLGHLPQFLPTEHGFDYFFGLPYSNDMRPGPKKRKKWPDLPLIEGKTVIEKNPDQTQLTRRYTEKAVEFITKNKEKPFFLYLAHTFPHVPLYASERFKGKSERGLYGDVVEEIDWSVGQVLDTLKKEGLEKNTLVVFLSDNGPWLKKGKDGGSALPLRDGKATVWEGGLRVPCIARWPGRIPQGRVCSEVATAMDFLPTLAVLAGARVPNDRVIDGKDIWPLMVGKEGAKSPHETFFYFRADGQLGAVRKGKWKYHRPGTISFTPPKRAWGVVMKTKIKTEALYDLEADIGEKNNVAAGHPETTKDLKALLDAFQKGLKKRPGAAKGKKK